MREKARDEGLEQIVERHEKHDEDGGKHESRDT
jgi:hypothetical protein